MGSGSQEEVEEAAKEEIREIVGHKEAFERRKAEVEAERRKVEKEKEDMGAMWGMGKINDYPLPFFISSSSSSVQMLSILSSTCVIVF